MGCARLWVVFCLLFTLGCKSQSERELGAEIAKISLAVNSLRDAPHNQKTQPLDALRTTTCERAEACEYRQICLQAYELHAKSTAATEKVRVLMREGQPDPAQATRLLELGERELSRARSLMARCVELQGLLERETR